MRKTCSLKQGASSWCDVTGNGNGDFSQGTFNLGGEGVTSNDEAIERIEIYATGRLIGLNESDWKTNHHHSCWESTLGMHDFNNLTTAMTACALDEKCSGVHDQGCFAHDPSMTVKLRLCDKRVASSLHWSAPKPCIHAKPGDASHGEDWSATIDDKWCAVVHNDPHPHVRSIPLPLPIVVRSRHAHRKHE